MFSFKCNQTHTTSSMYLVYYIIYFMKCLAHASLLKQQSHCKLLMWTGLHQFLFSRVTFMWVLLSIQNMYATLKSQMEAFSNLHTLTEEIPVSSLQCWCLQLGEPDPLHGNHWISFLSLSLIDLAAKREREERMRL